MGETVDGVALRRLYPPKNLQNGYDWRLPIFIFVFVVATENQTLILCLSVPHPSNYTE
jgi:hypothetical protein